MSTSLGTSCDHKNVVFEFDMENTKKSWIGKPGTNLLTSAMATCSGALTRQTAHHEAYTYTNNVAAYGRKDTTKITITPSGNTSDPYADFGFQAATGNSATTGDKYYISFDYKTVKGGDEPALIVAYADGYKNPTNANVGTFDSATVVTLPDGWKRRTVGVTITSGGNGGHTHWRFGQSSSGEEVEFYVDNFQVVESPVPMAWRDGTLSSTQGLLDISGEGNTITLGNLTYNSDYSFEFDGTDDFFTLPVEYTHLESCSFEIVITFDAIPTQNQVLFGYKHIPGYSLPPVGSIYMLGTSGFRASVIDPTNVYTQIADTTNGNHSNLSTNTTYHVVVTKDVVDGSLKIYRNGVLGDSDTFSASGFAQWTSVGSYIGQDNLDVGRSSNTSTTHGFINSYFNGKLYKAKIYNKALSADEVTNLFESIRGRYGI